MPAKPIFDANGETTVAVPWDPEVLRRLTPEALVRRTMRSVWDTCRQIGARPIAGRTPDVLSEREMRQVDPGAVLWKPGRTWIAYPCRRDSGESTIEVRDLSPE